MVLEGDQDLLNRKGQAQREILSGGRGEISHRRQKEMNKHPKSGDKGGSLKGPQARSIREREQKEILD